LNGMEFFVLTQIDHSRDTLENSLSIPNTGGVAKPYRIVQRANMIQSH
jgi:hypothetical protein